MIITPIKTHKITSEDTLFAVLDKYLPKLHENIVVAVTSKIISITEGRMVKIGSVDKDQLIEQEAQYYLPRKDNKYNVSLTVTNNNLVATAGIDESNGNGYYILWPKDVCQSANTIREHIQKRFNIKNVGVIITDSRSTPLRWGVMAIAIAYSGFVPLKDYMGKPDVFGRKLVYEKMSIMDNLASAAALVMGEGDEQTPLAVIEEAPHVIYQSSNPTQKELDELKIDLEDDLYAPFLKAVSWKKGKKS